LIATNPELQEFMQAVPEIRRMLQPLCHALGIDIDKPYGVPLVTIPAPPATRPESTAAAPRESPRPVECALPSTDPAPPPRTP